MAAPILSLKDIRLTFGGTPLLTGAELIVGARERIALVGRNGSGKSSLLKVAAGLLVPDAGEVFVQPGLLVRYLAQEPDLSAYRRVDDYVQDGLGPMGDPQRARQMVEKLGLKGDQVLTSMSGGELRRVAIVRAMAANPDVLLMDEPTNHLDIAAIEWLEGELGRSRAALVLISHDRRFLENLSRSTVWLDRGVTRRIEKGFSGFEAYRDEVLEAEELAQHKLDRKIAAEEHWVRYGVAARRKRNMGRMARLQGLREERREWRGPPGAAVLEASEAQASGKLLVEAKHLDLSFGDRAIVRDFSFRIRAGDRVGIAGPNGTGKTSLVRLLTGDLSPDGGSVKIGATSALQVLAQNRDSLDPEKSLKDTLTGGGSDKIEINGSSRHVVSYMKDFLFTPEQAGTPVGRLSGGERARVALARALALPSNFLVLDEPTNDLDLETLDLLQEMLADYSGTLILVSHDRDFLDRVATLMLAPEGEGRWVEYAGGYSDMQAQRKPGSLPLKERRVASSRAESSRPESLHNVASAQTQKKLSFKQQHALKVLPGRIAELFAEMTAVQEALSNPDFYGRDPEGFAKKSKALEALGREHAGLEEEWLALEILQEQMSRSD